jgi:2'-5' RNA ligase
MRLFVAIDLSDRQHAEAERAAQVLQRALEKARAAKAIRWVAPAQMHLTVRFIGEVDVTMGARVVEALGATLGCRAFTLALGQAGTFPAGSHPRVVWIGVEEARGGGGAGAAHEEIERRLVALGLDPDERPFRAHLTLGRVRDPRRFSAAQFRALRGAMEPLKIDPAPATVDHATLYRSHLSPKGPWYEPLARLSFGPRT